MSKSSDGEQHDPGRKSSENILFEALFAKYNKHIRPIEHQGDVTQVFFELSIFNILYVDTKLQQMKTNTEMIMKWKDYNLKWNPDDYNGTTSIRIPYRNIWFPDIILVNTADSNYEASVLNTNAIITHQGEVELLSHAILTTVCLMDVQWYPFDQQTCRLTFASWTYDNTKIRLVQGPADLSKFRQNPEFFLEDFYSELDDVINPCCPTPISTISYYLQVQRRTIYSLFFFIMPGILINFCALMVFSLPSESGEKIGLGTNSMLAMMVFLMAMTEKLPPTEKIPLAGVYYGTCISLIAFNIALSVIVLNLNVVGLRGYHVPVFLRVATLFVARAILVKIPAVVKKAWDVDEQSKKITPVQKLKTAMNKDGDNMVRVFVVQPQHAKSPKLEDKKESKQFPEDELDPHVLTDPFQRRAIAALESINKILSQEAADRDHATKKNDLVEEWKFISRVMDRTLFISFTLLTFFFNISILTSSPFRERFDYCPLGDKGECDKLTWEEIIEITSHAATDTHFSEGDMSHNWGGEHGSSHVLHNDYIVNTFQIPEVAYDGFDDMPPHDAAAPVSATHGMIGSSVIKRIDSPDQYDEGDSLEEENDLSLTPKSNPSTSPKNHLSPTSRTDPSTTSRSDPSTASRNDSSTTSRSDSSTNSGNGSSTTSSSDPSTIKNKRSSNSSSHPNTTVNHHSSISRNESPTTTKNRPGEV